MNKISKIKDCHNPSHKNLYPDIITNDFIGDVKYYNISDIPKTSFDKELYAYNTANGNLQPNFVFIPSEETKFLTSQEHDIYKLKIITLNLHEIVNDCFHQQNNILKKNQRNVNFLKTNLPNAMV